MPELMLIPVNLRHVGTRTELTHKRLCVYNLAPVAFITD